MKLILKHYLHYYIIRLEKKMYPSAGARFPLEFYVIIMNKVEDIPTGVYHYDVNSHRLTSLITMTKDELIATKISTYEFVNSASVGIICTSILSRSTIKYGERAYRFGLIEAGTTCQNFSLVATCLGVGSVIIGGLMDDSWETLLDIDGFDESVVYGMFFG
jgi:SagB-type dehydrogenase family enzyme